MATRKSPSVGSRGWLHGEENLCEVAKKVKNVWVVASRLIRIEKKTLDR